MQAKSAYARRSARVHGVFGSDDPAVVMRGLREQRMATLAGLLRRALAAFVPGSADTGIVRSILRSLSGEGPQPHP